MKARFDHTCQPRRKNAPYEAENIFLEVDLPFVPAVGTMLKLTPRGDYMEVRDVMLDLTPNGEGLLIGIKEPDEHGLRPWPEMKSEGWQLST